MEYKKFAYKTLDELKSDIAAEGVSVPVADSLAPLTAAKSIGNFPLKNTMLLHPMEGCDCLPDGTPSDLTVRRYERFAKGGAGLIWFEACAVCYSGKANPRQMLLDESTLPAIKALVDTAKKNAPFEQYYVLQLTHSGRYSRQEKPAPVIAAVNPYLDPFLHAEPKIITDDELIALEDAFVVSAKLAEKCGFHAVDIKSCHRYLLSELLSARTREGLYGGSFENRTRFLCNVVDKVKAATNLDISVRINAYDGINAPYGFGMSEDGEIDLSEITALAKILEAKGVKLINITGGNPYYNPHVNRPYDQGSYIPPCNQLTNASDLLSAAKAVKEAAPSMVVAGTGLSWFRQFGANVAAGCLEDGWFDLAGFGRQAFAYPEFPNDITHAGEMDKNKCCIACSKCSVIMRDNGKTGCVIRDAETYVPLFQAGREGKPPITMTEIKNHI